MWSQSFLAIPLNERICDQWRLVEGMAADREVWLVLATSAKSASQISRSDVRLSTFLELWDN